MRNFVLGATATALTLMTTTALAQQRPTATGDKDDQIVLTGCVMKASREATPRSLLVWSRGDVFLDAAGTDVKPAAGAGQAVGTGGRGVPTFYWVDDEDDFARHVGKRVEIVGELSERFDKGQIEVEHKDDVTELEFDWKGQDVTARVPTAWLGPNTAPKDSEFDIAIRRIDVEKVTVVAERCN